MLPNLENATYLEWAAMVAAMGVVLFGGWNCVVDILPRARRRRTDEESRRLADQCAVAVMEAYGPRNEGKREFWRGKIAKVLHKTLSFDSAGGRPKGPGAKQSKSVSAVKASRQRVAKSAATP